MSDAPARRPAPTVVVVNDSATQLCLLCELVRRAGAEPQAFASAQSALDALDRAVLPDLVVTDIRMPGMDGWQFCRRLRSPGLAAYGRVPILVVSAGLDGDGTGRLAAELGAEVFPSSPLDGQRFIERVQGILQGGCERPAAPATACVRLPVVSDCMTARHPGTSRGPGGGEGTSA